MSFSRIQNIKPSSMIYEMHYDKDSRVLRVKFNRGDIFDYFDVEPEIVDELVRSESLGKAFNALVKMGGYRYHSVGSE